MKLSLVALLVAVALLCGSPALSNAAMCSGKPDPNAQPNNNPPIMATPVFLASVVNAKLYTVGSADDAIAIVHLWGTPYEMGYAHGVLRNETMRAFIADAWAYLEEQVEEAINGTFHHLKPWFVDLVAEHGLEKALDLTIDATKAWTGDYFDMEIQGMADATKVDALLIRRIHMFGEVTRGDCSMFGASNTATYGGGLLQMRALDWDVDGPFRNFPQITVYHPDQTTGEWGHAFANIGFTGFIGTVTGVSSTYLGVSEIGVSFPDNTFGQMSRFGVPFTYVLRDILQFDYSLGSATSRLRNAHRTCDLILGVGDGKTSTFRSIQYSASVANIYSADNMMPEASWHARIQDIVYYGMDWLCPSFNQVLHDKLAFYHGELTAQIAISNITSIVQTGNLHLALYDFGEALIYVANARPDGGSGPAMAYDRTFKAINLNVLFNDAPPS
eukprot:m.155940 g.155940  ORF g.155940 m.155940 type:complete len:444 (-) comp16974_c0_seq11:564-1895(-)